jgi:hypothetical protein
MTEEQLVDTPLSVELDPEVIAELEAARRQYLKLQSGSAQTGSASICA